MTTTMTDGCARRNTTWLRPVVTSYNTTLQQFNTSILHKNIHQLHVSSFTTSTLNAYLATPPFLLAILTSRESALLFSVRRYPFKHNLTRRWHAAFTTITILLQHYTTNDNIFIITLTNYHLLHQFFVYIETHTNDTTISIKDTTFIMPITIRAHKFITPHW